MEHIRNFLRGKGFALALLACVAAAAAVGVWAVRTVRDQMARDLGQDPGQSVTGEESYPGVEEGMDKEEAIWQQQAADVAQAAEDVPEPGGSKGSSGAPSGSGSASEPSELQTGSPAASA